MKKELKIDYDYYPSVEEMDEQAQMLFQRALEAREKAYAPYSNFLVGCALLLDSGVVVTGNNQENAAFPSGTCAERSAIFWTSSNFPKERIKTMMVVGGPLDERQGKVVTPPCGACRQSILEYEARQEEPITLYFASVDGEVYRLGSVRDLLPFSFDASYL
ncbi:cytidine deaminase [Bergeyella sp. RCAD1439]|uniref:cytidine deaminase n=1 Tax=Bergeyella anatis TaxID=3113737 RepID=UPI002E178530|nr:cytidine deaminase [Bergeyella sp. RCAD1439]